MEGRSLKILEAIVDEFIRTGEPVGSKALQEKLDINISSATIRNEMASLEQQGYLEHPHTSAGRVPTFKGYRLYIEKFAPESRLTDEQRESIDKVFEGIDATSSDEIITEASRALAAVTKCAIVSTNETSKFSVITKIDVIPTGKRMYVLLLITSSGSIKNRVCRLSFDLTNEQLAFFQRFANENLTGMNLDGLTEETIEKLTASLGAYIMTLSPLIKGVIELSEEMLRNRVDMHGESNLITCEDFKGNEVATIIESKNELTEILSNAFSGVNIMFGKEDSFVVSNSSIITSPFSKDGVKAGSFGLIGPMRLDYKKIIPYIEYFSDKVTSMLSQRDEDEMLLEIEKETQDDE